jgi:hypothetical protein
MLVRPITGPVTPALDAALRGGTLPWDGGIGGGAPSIIWEADFSALSAGAVATLPAGLSFSRAGDGYSVRDGASVIVSGLGTDVPRAGRRSSAHAMALCLEEPRTALTLRSAALTTSPWSLHSGSAPASGLVAPDGSSSSSWRIQTTAAQIGLGYYHLPALTNLARYVVSGWHRGVAGGESMQLVACNGALTAGRAVARTLTTEWDRSEVSFVAGTDTAANLTTCFVWAGGYGFQATTGITGGVAAGARDAVAWGLQHELGGFATSYIPTVAAQVSRVGERLYHASAAALIRSGRLAIEVAFRPHGASTRYGADMYIWKSGSDYCRIEYSTASVVLSIGGVVYVAPIPMAWSAGDLVELFVAAGGGQATEAVYRVNGGTTLLLSAGTPAALAGNVDNSGAIDLLCNGTAGQLSAFVEGMTAYA